MTSATQVALNKIPFLPGASPFGCPELQQQAGKIKNAAADFCQTTFDNLRHLGNTGIDFLKKCQQELGEKEGKSAFDNWLDSDGFGASKYVFRVAMKIAARYSNLKPRLQKLARDNVQVWGLRALEVLFGVSDDLFELMIKRGKRSHLAVKKIENMLEGKQPTLPPGGFVEVTVDDGRQLKGKIGVIEDKDEHGNIVVRLVETGTDITLKSQDVTKKTPKSVNQCLIQVIEELHQESLQKDLELSEYQSGISSEPTTEVLEQSERDRIAASAIAAYKLEQAQKDAALYDETKAAASLVQVEYDAALASANAQIEALNQTIQKLTQQVEDKEKLTQVIGDLQCQLEKQALRSQQLESQNQQLRQQVAEFQLALAGTNLPDNINKQESSTMVGSVVESNYNIQLREIESPQSCNKPARSSEVFPSSELDEYKAAKVELPAKYIEISQAEFLSIKEKLEDSESSNLELTETIEILRDVMHIMKTEQEEKEWEQNIHKLDKQLSKMSSRPATAPPRGFGNAASRK